MIEYIKGNVLRQSDTNRIITHVTNTKGGFGKGFALELANRYPKVRTKYKELYAMSLLYGDAKFKLGVNQLVFIDENLSICNMIC